MLFSRPLSLVCAMVLGAGCPPGKPPEPQGEKPLREVDERPSEPRGKEVKSVKLPKSMVIGDNVTLSGFYEDEELPADGSDPAGGERPVSRPGGGGQAVGNVYKTVAPATVIVSTGGGYGSGVLYHPDGWILTNHHVIAAAEREDFRMKVKVGLGKLTRLGVIERQGEMLDAYVHKMDALRDIAVIKLVKPPAGLKLVAISATDPKPGERVWSLGHAGIGLMWAIKDGDIAAIGKLSQHLAQLLLLESRKAGKAPTGRQGALVRMRAKRLEEYRKQLAKQKPALVIQSTCDISQGDSGGPLVNSKAELVGLNSFIRQAMGTRKESNFHIHVSELRKFIQDVPPEPPQLVPDPWTEGGSLAKLGDADMDSRIDVLAMHKLKRYGIFRRMRPMAYFFDLDQDSFTGLPAMPSVRDVVQKRSFDAEMVFLESNRTMHAWYDTNNDGKLDVLLVSSGSSTSAKGYRIDPATGKLTRDKGLDRGRLVRPELLAQADMSKRLLAAGRRVLSSRLLPPSVAARRQLPDPVQGAGHEGTLKDYSGDGKPETVVASGMFSSGRVLDLDQDTLGAHKVSDSLRQVLEQSGGKLDAELSWILQGRSRWVWYDTDNDGSFDLLLHAQVQPLNTVDEAWTVGADSKPRPLAGQLGRSLVQPDQFKDSELAATLRKVARRSMPQAAVAAGPGLKTFPDPDQYYTWGFKLLDIKRRKQAALEVRRSGCKGLLVDLDQDTRRKARKARKSVDDLARARKFDAELALVRCRNKTWAFYDSRGKGKGYDLVLYSSKGPRGKVEAAYDVDRKGQVTLRARAPEKGGLLQPELFKNRRLMRALKQMAPDLPQLTSGRSSRKRIMRLLGRGKGR